MTVKVARAEIFFRVNVIITQTGTAQTDVAVPFYLRILCTILKFKPQTTLPSGESKSESESPKMGLELDSGPSTTSL